MSKPSFLIAGLGLGLMLWFSGCTPSEALDRFTGADHEDAQVASEKDIVITGDRVYMDEISGVLSDFDGTTLCLAKSGEKYFFDVSAATVECKNGLLSGDEISVIYEGKLSGQNTGTVKALKVTDTLHKKKPLENRQIKGTLNTVSSTTIQLTTKKNRTLTCPTAGTAMYFEKGIHTGASLILTVLGDTPLISEEPPTADGSLIAVLSVSDVSPPPTPKAPTITTPVTDPFTQMQELRATILNLSGQTLHFCPDNSTADLSIDLAAIPTYLPGGALPGNRISIYFTGEYDEKNLSTIAIDRVIGADPESLNKSDITCYVSGTVIGSTANTLSILTSDNLIFTCYTDGVLTESADISEGSLVRIIFRPDSLSGTNIHTVYRIEDISS